jgi:ubiquinone/menaquinone biosynthesis C-methylase UbiE
MSEPQIKFDDGAAYEQFMGVWSHAAGKVFLDWLKPATGLHWLDVGCGNGAFTQMIIEHCDPDKVAGIDPSDGQLAFARSRPHAERAEYRQGDAMALPYADQSFDAAVMALVIFFVPEPERGVAEMVTPGIFPVVAFPTPSPKKRWKRSAHLRSGRPARTPRRWKTCKRSGPRPESSTSIPR